MTDTPRPAGVTPPVAVVFAAVLYTSLVIGALGVASLLTDSDVIPVRGLGPLPGVAGIVASLAGFAGVLLWGLRAEPPGFLTAVPCGLAAYVGEVVGIVVAALLGGADPARAVAAAGAVALGWPGALIGVIGAVAGLVGVALVRVGRGRPRWRWEQDDSSP